MLIIIGIIVVLFAALYFATNYKKNKEIEDKTEEFGNPYNKRSLQEETIEQLDNPLYQNQIIPKELDKQLESEETMTVYFYKADCPACVRATPMVVPVAEDLDIDMKKVNLLEFNQAEYWNRYGIESTPTIVHYKDGKEVARKVGGQDEADFKQFFEKEVLK